MRLRREWDDAGLDVWWDGWVAGRSKTFYALYVNILADGLPKRIP